MGGQTGEPGLESPIGQRILQNLGVVASGYGAGNIAGALVGNARSLGESGALFPEGGPLPTDRASLQELGQILPDSQKAYLRNQALENWHAENEDWSRVLADKWALLKNAGGN